MQITHSTARWIAPLSWAIDFAAQQYGIFSTPNMKAIHDANLSFWSPQPYFIAVFFFLQQIFQAGWLYRLWKLDANKSVQEKRELDQMLDFVPYYAAGNICIAVWMIFWNQSKLKSANLFVLMNSLMQLYYVFGHLPPMNTRSTSSVLTNFVSKTFAGIGILDLLHNGSVAYFDHHGPNATVKLVTGVFFAGLASISDWILGGCLVYDLLALAVGQRGIGQTRWSNLLGVYALATAGIVWLRNWLRPPYVTHDSGGYESISN